MFGELINQIDAATTTMSRGEVIRELGDLHKLVAGLKRGATFALRGGEMTHAAEMMADAMKHEARIAYLRHVEFLVTLGSDPAISALWTINEREKARARKQDVDCLPVCSTPMTALERELAEQAKREKEEQDNQIKY